MEGKRDPHFRGVEAYEYGDVREIVLGVHLSGDGCIIWHVELPTDPDGKLIIGGFPGPFEALAGGLAELKEQQKRRGKGQ
jgi:hypothetical protein